MFSKIVINTLSTVTARLARTISIGMCIAIISLPSVAATLAQEKKSLAQIKSSIASLEANVINIEADIKTTEAEVKRHYIKLAPLRKKLDRADATLIAARAASSQNPTDANKAKTSNAEFKYVLAERKYKKVEAKIAKSEAKIEKLQRQQTSSAKQLQTQRNALVTQQKVVNNWKPQQPKKVVTKPRPVPVRKPVPVKKDLPIAKTFPVAKPQKPANKRSTAKNVVPQLAQNAVKSSPIVKVAPKKIAKPKGPVEPEEQREKREDQAMVFQDRLDDLLDSTNKRKKAAFPNQLMSIEITKTNGQTYKAQIKLEHIKEQRYSGTAKMFAGNTILKVAKTKWSKKVPAWDDGKIYQFIYDGREGIGPVMTWYRKDLAR